MPDPDPRAAPRVSPHVLILGGTTEATALTVAVANRFASGLKVTYSLAGRATPRRPPPARLRIGGFGGVEGLGAFLTAEAVTAVVDATHPFAARISRHARLACAASSVPLLTLARPAWTRQPGDRWLEADDLAAAAAALPGLARRVFLTLGTADLAPFAALSGIGFTLRMIAPPAAAPFPGCTVIAGRGPFGAAEETALFRAQGFDALVTKASGGAATAGKLVAARTLGLPVVMVRRPPPEPGARVESVAAALEWLDHRLLPPDNPPQDPLPP